MALTDQVNSLATRVATEFKSIRTALAGKQATGDYATNTALTNGLASKANSTHSHVIADVTSLQAALDGKAAVPAAPTAQTIASGTITPDANVNKRYNYTLTGNATLGTPANGGDQDVIFMFFSASGANRVLSFGSAYYGVSGSPTSLTIPSGEQAYVCVRRSAVSGRWIVERASLLTALAVALEYLGAGAWVNGAASGSTAQYPAGLAENDVCYAVVHSRESTTVLPASAGGWTKVYEATGGSGTVGDSTGPTRMTFYKKVVPAGGLSGTATDLAGFGTTSAGAVIHGFRPRPGLTVTEAGAVNSRTTASTSLAGTTGTIDLAPNDIVLTAIGAPDDTVTDISLTDQTAPGITWGAGSRSPNATPASATGNDRAEATFIMPVATGTGTVALTYSGTQTTAETGITAALRIRAA
jgi:hypothetical protein